MTKDEILAAQAICDQVNADNWEVTLYNGGIFIPRVDQETCAAFIETAKWALPQALSALAELQKWKDEAYEFVNGHKEVFEKLRAAEAQAAKMRGALEYYALYPQSYIIELRDSTVILPDNGRIARAVLSEIDHPAGGKE